MILRRKIKYQVDYYKRMALSYCKCFSVPAWMYGKNARLAYAGIFGAILFAYICQVSVASGSGYEMRDLQKRVTALKTDIQKINVEMAKYNALPNLEKRVQNTGMVTVASINYIKSTETVVAKR